MKHPISNILCVLSVGFIGWILFSAPGFNWTGGVMKELPVRVLRSSDRQPVAGVRVLLLARQTFAQLGALELPARAEVIAWAQVAKASGLTDGQGRVTLRGQFPAGGQNSFLIERGTYRLRGEVGVITETSVLAHSALQTMLPDISRSLGDDLPEIELAIDDAPLSRPQDP